jgi:hypothetical protein
MKKLDIPKSGKCRGIVWQRGRYGQFSHALVIPANPRTSAQVAVRGIWKAVNDRWPRLTQGQRDVWDAAAKHKRSKTRLRQNGPLTGYLLFMKINVALAYWGKPQVDLPPKQPRFPQLAVSSLSVTNVAGVIKISLGCPRDPGDHTILRASLPQSARCNVCNDVRVIGTCPPPEQGSADITARYEAKFLPPPVGTKLFLRVNQLIDGWEDDVQEFTAIVPPPT